VSQNLPQHEKEHFEKLAREHRERNKRILEEQRRDNCGNLIAVCELVLLNIIALFHCKICNM